MDLMRVNKLLEYFEQLRQAPVVHHRLEKVASEIEKEIGIVTVKQEK